MTEKPQAHKAVIVKSVSLSVWEWNYLLSLAYELAVRDAKGDLDFVRASTSQAVRHLIQQDAKRRPKDAEGNPTFGAGPGPEPGQVRRRVLSNSTGTTAARTFESIVDLYPIGGQAKKKGGRK